jgi:hypothetical protein
MRWEFRIGRGQAEYERELSSVTEEGDVTADRQEILMESQQFLV